MGQLTEILLSHAVDPRPKVRKAAQGFVMSLIGQDVLPGEAKAAVESKALSFCASTFKACTSADTVSTQQLLGMVKELAPNLSPKAKQSLLLQLAKLISAEDKTMLAQVLGAIETVLQCSDPASVSEKHINKAVTSVLDIHSQVWNPIFQYIRYIKSGSDMAHHAAHHRQRCGSARSYQSLPQFPLAGQTCSLCSLLSGY